MYVGYTCEFRSPRSLQEILGAWSASGPFAWQVFENEDRGAYLVAREPAMNLRIRLYGDNARQYSVELDADIAAATYQDIRKNLLSTLLDVLLPGIAATGIRDTSHETSRR
jgi:hypothetical protein